MTIEELTRDFPQGWNASLTEMIQFLFKQRKISIVVLDDDPTGTQTVFDVPVITKWSVKAIRHELAQATPLFYVLTNSRSLTEEATRKLHATIGKNLAKAADQCLRDYLVISRSDSTLRGHYPAEIEALQDHIYKSNKLYPDLTRLLHVFIPAFFEGDRLTIGDTHYIREGEQLLPVGQSIYARDSFFGYQSSGLREWIEEKTAGRVKGSDVQSFSIPFLRNEGPAGIATALQQLESGTTLIVNAMTPRDLEIFALGYWLSGEQVLFRSAASLIPALAGLRATALLKPNELRQDHQTGALIVVGSHVDKTTRQIRHLMDTQAVHAVEIEVNNIFTETHQDKPAHTIAHAVNSRLRSGQHVLLYTSRQRIVSADKSENLDIAKSISAYLIDIVQQIEVRPALLLAKGGITASDIATSALKMKRSMVLGQVLPGVPVWKCGPESRFPGLSYIVFPGNVGADDALSSIVQQLTATP